VKWHSPLLFVIEVVLFVLPSIGRERRAHSSIIWFLVWLLSSMSFSRRCKSSFFRFPTDLSFFPRGSISTFPFDSRFSPSFPHPPPPKPVLFHPLPSPPFSVAEARECLWPLPPPNDGHTVLNAGFPPGGRVPPFYRLLPRNTGLENTKLTPFLFPRFCDGLDELETFLVPMLPHF